MKQTAVEWLVQQLSKEWQLEDRDLHLVNQAKEMELEKLKEAYCMGRMNKSIKEFNETFKSE